jgi:hypothetical protein
MIIGKDVLWKGIIEDLFEDFLHYFFPQYINEIDFSKGYEFLDKELQMIYPEANTDSKQRRADLLIKVFLRNGEEKWLLIHIEIQGYKDVEFPFRMYVYNYRSADRFGKNVVALAILTDDNPSFRPSFYEKKIWDTVIRYDYPMFKLLDYKSDFFIQSPNPFASVLQVARAHIKNKRFSSDENLLELKVELFRIMLEKGHDKKTIRSIANFIKYYVNFKENDFYSKFEEQFHTITKTNTSMGLLELVETMAKKESFEQGIEQGIEQGEDIGIKKERKKTIERMLLKGFSIKDIGEILGKTEDEISELHLEIKIEVLLKEFNNIDEISQILEIEKTKTLEIIEKLNIK